MVVRNTLKKADLLENVVRQAAKISNAFYVVNHGSVDETETFFHELSQKYSFHLEFANEPFEGTMDEMKGKHYQVLKNRKQAGNGREYIFILDWDEVLSDELVTELQNLNLQADVYKIERNTFFLGKVIDKWVFLPLLFKPEALEVGAFQALHDLYRIKSTSVQKLRNVIWHYSFGSFDDYLAKVSFYGKIEAQEMFKNNPNITLQSVFFKMLFGWIPMFGYTLIIPKNYKHKEGWIYVFCSVVMHFAKHVYWFEYLQANNKVLIK